jgi:hypothetical protein
LSHSLQNLGEHRLRAADRQIADVEMLRADIHRGADGARTHLFGAGARFEVVRQSFERHRQEVVQRAERASVRAPVEEHPEHPWQRQPATLRRADESRDRLDVVMADDLRQVELRVKVGRGEKIDLPPGVAVRVRPSAERDGVIALAQHLPELPRVLHASQSADGLVAAENDQGPKAALVRALGV